MNTLTPPRTRPRPPGLPPGAGPILALLVSLVLPAGCGRSGPASTDCTSAAFPTLQDRIDFLQRYVTFRRTFESLDFAIRYSNNSGGAVPGPSDWDVRLVAVVPASEIAAWIPAGAPAVPGELPDWLKTVPTSQDLSGIREWHTQGRQVVGLDRTRRIVAYRNVAQ